MAHSVLPMEIPNGDANEVKEAKFKVLIMLVANEEDNKLTKK